ncbi:MAG: enoyl-CoA hydratase/isomerase family protein [Chloroflexi bacterium]|nr:enoyl-CoA hydratase/isomerase family protein [Chloroflexota bacterium]
MQTNFETILYEKKDSLGFVTLNRPHVHNAFNIQMRDDLFQVLCAVRDDQELRAVIFRGAGEKAFCAGADLTEFGTSPSRVIARQVRWKRDIWGLFLSIEIPIIAALHGFVIGSGVEIASCCDLRVASEDAVFSLPEVALGMIPAAGGTQTVPRFVGRSQALEFLLTGDRVTAADALRIGLVNRVVPRADLVSAVFEVAHKLRGLNPTALRYAKRAINEGLDMGAQEGLDLEKRLGARLLAETGIGTEERA